jgi:hypothetical protein
MRMRSFALLALAACGSSDGPAVKRVDVAIVPATANHDVDVLFLIDDSTGMLDQQNNLKASFPAFINTLSEAGLPNLHIGVATSDLGTSAIADGPGPSIGSVGTGGCAGTGKAGNLQTNGTPLVSGTFIADQANADGTRTTNYTGQLADAFSAIASVGAGGCGFEQHLEAVRRALDNNPANVGFLRPGANLAVIIEGDEDDCSLEHASMLGDDTATLGPLQSFRCTHFGVTCDGGGATPDDMNTAGPKTGCHDNTSLAYMSVVADYKAFLDSLKLDPRMVMVGEIIGDPSPVAVELRPPAGGGTAIPALGHSCAWTDAANNTEVADPGVRLADLAGMIDRNVVSTTCQQDLSGPLVAMARQINSMTGSPCLVRDITMPQDCTITDDAGPVGDYQLVADPTTCPDGQHLKLVLGGAPHGSTVVSCTVP